MKPMLPRRSLLWSLALVVAGAPPAAGFDAASTHAGLAQKVALASSLKSRIAALFTWGPDQPHGLYQTLTLPGGDARREALHRRLSRLDPADGGAPSDGKLTALGWLIAGSILEETPPERAHHHFFDPTASPASPTSSVAWMSSASNDLSLARFIEARARSLTLPAAADRAGAAAESLLVAGALLHVVEDAAEPAYVHNDLAVDLVEAGAPFSRFVSQRYGRLAVPGPVGAARPLVHLGDALHGAGAGLADRTADRFYSLGLLAAQNGRGSGGATRPPGLPRLVAGPDGEGYFEDPAHRKLALFRHLAGGQVRWSLDGRCYQDAAAALLPEAAQAALSALEHLFRGGISLDAGRVRSDVGLGAGRLSVLVEDDSGQRREILGRDVASADAATVLAEVPAGHEERLVVAVFRGVDGAGEPLVASAIASGTPP